MTKDYVINNKELMKEWHWEKNNSLGIFPNKITLGSDKKAWWICKNCSYEWSASIGHRSHDGRACPKCANKLRMHTRVSHYGSLLEKNPKLCEEWNYEKNLNIKPNNVLESSGLIVWWKCKKCGHQWKASICNRNSNSNKTGCPKCSIVYQSSIAEKIVCYYISQLFPNLQENVRLGFLNNKELDMFIPECNIAIEYDGGAWHNNTTWDENKDYLCKENNITLIRIREKSCPKFNNSSFIIWTEKPKNSYIKLNQPIQRCLDFLMQTSGIKKNINVNIAKDYDNILGKINQRVIKNSVVNASFIDEWDYNLNKIQPQYVSIHSNKLIWWKCKKCGYSWKVSVNNRSSGSGCPFCAHKIVKSGYNDLTTTNPEILSEWDYTKNIIRPDEIMSGSNKKVWWKCIKHDHSWEASPNSRCNLNTGCPYCNNRKVLKGYNDLATTHPELLKEWNFSKNKLINPTDLVAGSNKKVWWKCSKCGQEWKISPNNRIYGKKTNCPRCAEKYIGQINKIKRRKKD